MPLPSNQLLSADITVNGSNDTFTITTAGRYRISYNVNTTVSLALGTRLLVGGSPLIQSTVAPLLNLSSYSAEVILDVAAGTTVSLQLYGLLGTAVLLNNSAGASMMIIRLS